MGFFDLFEKEPDRNTIRVDVEGVNSTLKRLLAVADEMDRRAHQAEEMLDITGASWTGSAGTEMYTLILDWIDDQKGAAVLLRDKVEAYRTKVNKLIAADEKLAEIISKI